MTTETKVEEKQEAKREKSASGKVSELLEAVKHLSVMELADLVKAEPPPRRRRPFRSSWPQAEIKRSR